MEAKATGRHVGMSPRKVRLVVDQIRGVPVNEAYALLQFSPKAASEPVGKILRSAVANAQVRAEEADDFVDIDELVVRGAWVNEGRTLRRFRAAAQGRAAPRRKRSSHITVVVGTKE